MQIAIRLLHTAIYIVMVAAIVYIFFAALGGRIISQFLYIAIGLVTLECVIYIGSGWKCPLTSIAESLDRKNSEAFSPMIPKQLGRWTPLLFGSIFGLSLTILLLRAIFSRFWHA